MRWSWTFSPSSLEVFGFLPAGRLVLWVGQSASNGERQWGLWFMAERTPDFEGEWVGVVQVGVGGTQAVGA